MQQRSPKSGAEFSAAFKNWVADWERGQGLYRVPLKDLAEGIGVAFPTFSRWWNGIHVPDPESCFRIAKFLGISAEDVLAAAGHPVNSPLTLPSLLSAVQTFSDGWAERAFVLHYLEVTKSPDWQLSRSHWKRDVEDILMSSADLKTKATAIAQKIYSWSLDPARETPLSDKPLADGK